MEVAGSSSRLDILYIGNPLLDISIDDDAEGTILGKYKLEAGQATLASPEQMPIYDEIFKMDGRQIFPGGSALNSARANNYSYKQTDGKEQVAYMGCIGDDERGQALQDSLKSVGVEGRFFIDKETETGSCAVVVKGKERALCANLAAACKFPTDHLTSNMVSILKGMDKTQLTI